MAISSPVPLDIIESNLQIATDLATTSVPIVSPGLDATDIQKKLTEQAFECASHIIVCDGPRFVGLIRIEDLYSAGDHLTARDIMDEEPPTIRPGIDQEVAAWTAVHHKESALAVVNKEGEFIGLIPPYLLLQVLLKEHEEDLSRVGGFLQDTNKARTALQEPIFKRFWHRLPWLLLGLLGAFIAAKVVSGFESRLQEELTIAFFIPGIVYLADAVGTQTETIIVRGLSVGVAIKNVLWQELLTGITIGIVLAAISYPFLLWNWNDPQLAFGTSLSLLAACSTATLVAMVLPVLFNLFDIDPAFGSGPIATVIQDVLSILTYFFITTAIMF
ncbi:magnesium transporter [Halalkalibaculum sp. DA384]